MAIERLFLVAASGLAREVLSAIRASDTHKVIGFLDDNPELRGTSIDGVPVVGPITDAADHPEAKFLLCAGSGIVRRSIAHNLSALGIHRDRYATVVHPSAIIPSDCTVGAGTILLAHVVMTTAVSVGEHVVAMPNATLTHDNVIEDFATLCAGVTLGGSVRVNEAAYLGMNTSVRQGLCVGAEAVVGMGSVVLGDVVDGLTVAGNPARPLRRVSENRTLASPVLSERGR
ncbi:sugar O-acyltransferase (sialic acid O-acetyltransferase NeuD family) [Antricoccus suffuscus]|uniref:Sugar O-acyltransferase (Sialic acid O-acetyltransferase NeuD family) n=1 Tax=Antricoccus suffuscus TaxID=1629062 RepID=A0A2T1A1L7_9ACTN|nr:acetyltransferase [Antricoccus suffuscus]PRZ42499.1 sugar O-acyltransferase (sialic acid O-acetyltransferase NeuD family) [Antricoccus suffuscus]